VEGVTTICTGVTVTVAFAIRVGSAALAAVTVYVPFVPGAVQDTVVPVPLMVPPVAVHVTAELVLLVTAATNCCVPPAPTVVVAGVTVMPTAFTWTVALALFVGSPALVAVTVNGPPPVGAVQTAVLPEGTIEPPEAVHVTDALAALVTVAEKLCVAPAFTVAVEGEMDTTIAAGGAVESPPPQAANTNDSTNAVMWCGNVYDCRWRVASGVDAGRNMGNTS
jgi:hypothetical protein